MSDNPHFLMRVMSVKWDWGQPTIHVEYADSGLTDAHLTPFSSVLSDKPDITVHTYVLSTHICIMYRSI